MTTVVAVREILQGLGSSHAKLFESLVENGTNSPYRCSKMTKQRFGPSEFDFPSLGKRHSPFDASTLSSAEELWSRCLQDAKDSKVLPDLFSFERSATCATDPEKESELQSGQDLVDIHAPPPAVLSFPSPYLEDLCQGGDDGPETVLRESMMTCMMLPDDTLLPLQHSNEGMTYTTLLSGSVIWVMWPSTEHNVAVIQSVYDSIARGLEDAWVQAVHELQGGVFFKQTQGECLRISPLCPMICLSTEASLLATHSILDAHELVSTLRRLPFLEMWFKTEVDGERKQSEFNSTMIEYLKLILQGEFDSFKKFKYPYTKEGPLKGLLSTWDEVKDKVADVLDPADADILRGLWLKFLRAAKGRPCWICGTNIYNKKKDMGKHFDDRHWSLKRASDTVMPNEIRATNEPKSAEEHDETEVEQINCDLSSDKRNIS
jgi:hypothetical protein